MKRVSGPTLVLTAVATVLALVVGVPAASTTPTAQSAAAKRHRPDMVLILMDDFSLELLRRCRRHSGSRRGCVVRERLRHRLPVLPLPGLDLHRAGSAPDRRADQHAERPDNPIGGYEAFAQYGNAEKSFNVALEDSGYTTGFVGKFLNRYEAKNVDGVQPSRRRRCPGGRMPR